MAAPTLTRYSTCFWSTSASFFLLYRLNMVKIELLIPLSYFGIARTSSTEKQQVLSIAESAFLFLAYTCTGNYCSLSVDF